MSSNSQRAERIGNLLAPIASAGERAAESALTISLPLNRSSATEQENAALSPLSRACSGTVITRAPRVSAPAAASLSAVHTTELMTAGVRVRLPNPGIGCTHTASVVSLSVLCAAAIPTAIVLGASANDHTMRSPPITRAHSAAATGATTTKRRSLGSLA